MGRAGDWRGISTGLDERFFRMAVDLPGHGASLGMPRDRYTIGGAARPALRALDGRGGACVVSAAAPRCVLCLVLPRSRYTVGGAARSVLEVLDGAGVDRATLVGYS